jgi:hypothetical protein
MKPRYLGPNIIVLRNQGGAYIICELDGLVFHKLIAAFRILPYFPRKLILLPDNFFNIDTFHLHELKEMELSATEVCQKDKGEYDKQVW